MRFEINRVSLIYQKQTNMSKVFEHYYDEMDEDNIDAKAAINNPLYGKLIRSITGKMDETEGQFEIELKNGDTLKYKYVFKPHRNFEKKGESYFLNEDNDFNTTNFDFEDYCENYLSGFGAITGAMAYYTQWKLGLKEEVI